MLRVRFKFEAAFNLLEVLSRRLQHPEALLASAAPIVARAIERNFAQEGRPLPWPPLSPAYARWKERFYPGRKILERTGRLRRSIHTAVEGNALVVSTDVPYAAAHQFGTTVIPARPFLVLTPQDKQEVAQALADALAED